MDICHPLFYHLLSPRTIQEATARYRITNKDTLAPQFASYITGQPALPHISNNQHWDPRRPPSITASATSNLNPTITPNHHQDPTIPTTPAETNSKTPTPPSASPSCHHIASPTDAQDPNMTSAPDITPTSPANPPLASYTNDHHYITPPTDIQDPPAPPMEQTITATPNDISTNHPPAPSGPLSTSAQQPPELTADQATSSLAPPTQIEYPY